MVSRVPQPRGARRRRGLLATIGVAVSVAVCYYYDLVRFHSWGDLDLRVKLHHDTGTMGSRESEAEATTGGFVGGVYYTNWSRYGRQHFVKDLDAEKISLVLYAFLKPTESGAVVLTDPWSDIQAPDGHGGGESRPDQLYGNFARLYELKTKHRHIKVLLSVGGWTLSNQFSAIAADEGKRSRFVSSCVDFVEDLGVDGVDVDWEYPVRRDDIPTRPDDASNFVKLLRGLRQGLDEAAGRRANDVKFWLTAAVPAAPKYYDALLVRDMNAVLDYFLLMAYDFSGPGWSATASHMANPRTTAKTDLSADSAVKSYTSRGVPSTKIILGIPLYGRVFDGTDGLYAPFNGSIVKHEKQWEAGTWDSKFLPRPGAVEHYDDQAGASYSYDPSQRQLVTYDNLHSGLAKATYIRQNNLGGWFFWESSGDNGLVQALHEAAAGKLERRRNCLEYPRSKYVNVRGTS